MKRYSIVLYHRGRGPTRAKFSTEPPDAHSIAAILVEDTVTVARKSGRPAATESEQRIRHLLLTAQHMFFEQGYGATSLDGIAAAAGVAKTTIYRHFGNKRALFEKCVTEATAGFRVQLAAVTQRPQPVEDGLRYIAHCLLEVIYQPASVRLMRVLFAESPRFPELGRAYTTHAKAIFMTEMVEFLARHTAAGRLAVDDPTAAADQFHHLIMAGRYFDVLLGTVQAPLDSERSVIAERAVRVFLRGYGRDS